MRLRTNVHTGVTIEKSKAALKKKTQSRAQKQPSQPRVLRSLTPMHDNDDDNKNNKQQQQAQQQHTRRHDAGMGLGRQNKRAASPQARQPGCCELVTVCVIIHGREPWFTRFDI